MLVAVDGPALATTSVYVRDWPAVKGPEVVNVLSSETSADAGGAILFEGCPFVASPKRLSVPAFFAVGLPLPFDL